MLENEEVVELEFDNEQRLQIIDQIDFYQFARKHNYSVHFSSIFAKQKMKEKYGEDFSQVQLV